MPTITPKSPKQSRKAARRSPTERRPLPLGAVLAALVGMGLLGAYGLYRPLLREWPDSLELACVTGASFLLIWGLTELAGGLFFRSTGWGDAPGTAPPRLGTASWIGMLLISLGAGGLFLVPWESRLGVVPLCLLVAGVGCLIYGAKRFVDRLVRGQSGGVERQTVSLTKAGAISLCIAIVFLMGAFVGPSNMLMLMFAIIAGPFIMNGWYAFRMIRRLSIVRNLPPQVIAGEAVTVTVTLSNRKTRMSTWLMGVADSITRISGERAGERLVAETLFQRVPPQGQRDASYRLRLMQRGRYAFGPIRVRSRFPLGLVERSRFFSAPGELIVGPRLGRLTDRWYSESVSADELVQRQRPRRGVFPDEFEKLRGFRYGDNPRLIHWRTSARQNSLMIREYQEIRDRDLLILLDLALLEETEELTLRAELAVSFAATLCIDQLRRSRQSRLGIAVAGREPAHWSGVAHPNSADPLLGMLALVEACPRPDFQTLWNFAREERTATTSGILITTRPAGSVSRPAGSNWIRTISVSEESLAEYFRLS